MAARVQSSRTSNRRAREREARVHTIREAAERVFATYGFEAATMEMVADEAELGKATLYYYFQNKHELFSEIVSSAMLVLKEGAASEAASFQGDARAAIFAICRFAVDFFADRPHMARLLVPLMAAGPEALAQRLGDSLAKEVQAAHLPVMRSLARVEIDLPQAASFVPLMTSVVLGISTKLASTAEGDGAAIEAARAAAHEELDLFFAMLRAPRSSRRK